jgi:hypothetical protein
VFSNRTADQFDPKHNCRSKALCSYCTHAADDSTKALRQIGGAMKWFEKGRDLDVRAIALASIERS